MKEILLDIVKGMLIGVANVIPGVSGGTIAVSTGVYEKIIKAINNLGKDFKKSIQTLWPFAVGMILGVVLLAYIITMLLEKFPVPTTACFVGMVLGGVPYIYSKIKDEKIKVTHIIGFIITLMAIIIPSVIAISTNAVTEVEFNFGNIVILISLGIISATAMVVPGVSGSMILMMLGYYKIIIETIKNTISSLIKLDFTALLHNIAILVPFGIGVVLGIIIVSKMIEYILKKWPNFAMWAILGLIVASPFAIIINIGAVELSPVIIIFSIIMFAIGFIISNKLGEN